MGTVATIHVVSDGPEADEAMERAFAWFSEIEERCTRFDPRSELMRLCSRVGEPVEVSAILFETVMFAFMLAEETGGAFDPTVGREMEARGFNREHRTGEIVRTGLRTTGDPGSRAASYRDIQLDADRKTITLLRPLTLDLGAVAKGFAVDLAARELARFQDFAIDAGGDLYLGGLNPEGQPWRVGIRHPRHEDALIRSLQVSNQAVCTSGDYERRIPGHERAGIKGDTPGHHILDPRSGTSAQSVASATVVASGAMLADALATAVFVLGPEEGIQLLTRMEVDGLIVTPELETYKTEGWPDGA
jgi:thiamine biosynthesis lipoprotein